MIIGIAMMCASYWEVRILNEWIYYLMVLQVIGLLRYSRYPIVSTSFNVLQGFSVCEFLYIPNYLKDAFSVTYAEVSYDIISFINTNHNFLYGIGSELLVFAALQLPIIALLIWKREAIFATVKKI